MFKGKAANINHLAISQRYGTVIRPASATRFGGFGLTAVSEQIFSGLGEQIEDQENISIERQASKLLVDSFQETHKGYSLDYVLCNPKLTESFVRQCKEQGLPWGEEILLRHLMAIRKNPKSYGVSIPATTQRARINKSVLHQSLSGVEMVLTRVKHTHSASVDDVLVSPIVREDFDNLCRHILPEVSILDCRRTALYIRKDLIDLRRGKHQVERDEVSFSRLTKRMKNVGQLLEVSPSDLSDRQGLFTLTEKNSHSNYLFCGAVNSLRPAVMSLAHPRVWSTISNGLWCPNLQAINLRIFDHPSLDNQPIELWAARLIEAKQPLLNLKAA